jgi:CxxC motif-containing protein
MTKTLTCIVCPLGCQISVAAGEAKGYSCIRGKNWAVQETTMPMRVLTTTVLLKNGELALLPVRTQGSVPKSKLMDCLRHANRLRVQAPVQAGQVLCQDLAATGVSLIAARSAGKK